jgi:hypothetical protein
MASVSPPMAFIFEWNSTRARRRRVDEARARVRAQSTSSIEPATSGAMRAA